jgi:hypothetical protein
MDGRWRIHSQECILDSIPRNIQQVETFADLEEGKGGTQKPFFHLDATT